MAADVLVDAVLHRAFRRAAAVGTHALPEEVVVPRLRRVVVEAGLLGLAFDRPDDIEERLLLEIGAVDQAVEVLDVRRVVRAVMEIERTLRSEEHTSELQSLMRLSDAVFCLQTNKIYIYTHI